MALSVTDANCFPKDLDEETLVLAKSSSNLKIKRGASLRIELTPLHVKQKATEGD